MRSLKRAYSTVAEVVTGVLIVSLGLGAAAAWIAPRWAGDVLRSAVRAVAARDGLQLVPAGSSPAPPATPLDGGRRELAPPQAELKSRVDAAALETRLRLLQGVGPIAGVPPSPPEQMAADLRAWESLRTPLVRLLEADEAGLPGPGKVSAPAQAAELAPRVLAHLQRLEGERQQAAERLLKTLDPSALARMLADEDGLSPEQARQVLRRLSPAAAAQLLDKLSRLAPAQAARLLEAAFPATTGSPPHLTRGKETHG